jgi:2-keto-4-pentenoate hydratase/2-oxohepta-3-ene-1,7-dioic acid hydratase in catechol pathway
MAAACRHNNASSPRRRGRRDELAKPAQSLFVGARSGGRETLAMARYHLASYQAAQGARAGLVIDERLFDAAELAGVPAYASVLGILDDWDKARTALAAAAGKADAGKGRPLAQITLRAPVLWPPTIYCAGANYADHVAEMAKRRNQAPEPDPHKLGLKPWHFIKASRALADPGATIAISGYSRMMDWEAELAAVIGRPARNVSIEDALDHVAGYTIGNDLSARDYSRRPHISDTSPFKADWLAHKSFEGACPLGPWITPAEDIADPHNLGIKLWVNDVIKQDSNTGEMIFNLAEQISHISGRITLHPGDVILTGTPAGVGAGRNEFLQAGDVVKVWIERIGTLTNSFS